MLTRLTVYYSGRATGETVVAGRRIFVFHPFHLVPAALVEYLRDDPLAHSSVHLTQLIMKTLRPDRDPEPGSSVGCERFEVAS